MALGAAFNLGASITKRKNLGSLVRRTMSAWRFADKTQLFLAGGVCILWTPTFFLKDMTNQMKGLFVILFVVAIAYLLAAVLNLLVTPGFYEKGISTGSGILLYREIRGYSQGHYASDETLKVFYFNPNRSGKSSLRLVVHQEEEKEAKGILKKKCSFK